MSSNLSVFLFSLHSVICLWHEHPGVAKALWGLGLEFTDFHQLWIGNFFALFFWQACNDWFLAEVLLEVSHRETLLEEVQFDRIGRLSVVKSDLDTTSAFTDASEVVFLNCSVDYVLAAADSFQIFSFEVFRQISNNQIDNFRLSLQIVVLKR